MSNVGLQLKILVMIKYWHFEMYCCRRVLHLNWTIYPFQLFVSVPLNHKKIPQSHLNMLFNIWCFHWLWMQLGFAETILLNASLSWDPNEPDGSLGLEFDWACIPDNRTLMSRLPFNSKPASILSFLPIRNIIYSGNLCLTKWQR